MHFTYKNTLLIVLAILIVGGAFGLAEYRNKQAKKVVYTATELQAVTDALTPELQIQDSDNDGLKDWEEVLLGTDQHKADTDGDGTSDGAEAAAGRNPLVKGPNDTAAATKDATASTQNLTPTDQLARDFFARYMELNQTGLASDKDSQLQLIGDVLKNGIVLSRPKLYASSTLLVKNDASKEAIRAYGNEVGALILKNNTSDKNEVLVAKESIDTENPELLKQIDPIITSYKNILNGLLKISVPAPLAENHLLMINSISTLHFAAESLRKIDTDTLSGVQGSSVWLKAVTDLNRSFNALKSSFVANGIVYSPTEPGSFFIPQ